MTISCHFRDCKALLVANLARVRGAIASTRPFNSGGEVRIRLGPGTPLLVGLQQPIVDSVSHAPISTVAVARCYTTLIRRTVS